MHRPLLALVAATAAAAIAAPAHAQFFRPDSDNRSGNTSTRIGTTNDPNEAGYNIDPSEIYLPRNLNINPGNQTDGQSTSSASLVTSSAYRDWAASHSQITGLDFSSAASGQLTLAAGQSGHSIIEDRISMGFVIEGLPAGQTAAFRLRGTMTRSGIGTSSIRVMGPGVNQTITATGAFDQVFTFTGNGEVQFTASSDVEIVRSTPGTFSGAVTIDGSLLFEPQPIGGPITGPNGNTYWLLQPTSWQQSQAGARLLGANLATLRDAIENEWVLFNLARRDGVNRTVWLGLNDAQTEGTLVWASGETNAFRFWAEGQPANTAVNDYVRMRPSDGRWSITPNFVGGFSEQVFGIAEATPACPADWNGDGDVNTADITAYLTAWFADRAAGTTLADVNNSGVTDTADITAFLSLWFDARAAGGC